MVTNGYGAIAKLRICVHAIVDSYFARNLSAKFNNDYKELIFIIRASSPILPTARSPSLRQDDHETVGTRSECDEFKRSACGRCDFSSEPRRGASRMPLQVSRHKTHEY